MHVRDFEAVRCDVEAALDDSVVIADRHAKDCVGHRASLALGALQLALLWLPEPAYRRVLLALREGWIPGQDGMVTVNGRLAPLDFDPKEYGFSANAQRKS